MKKRSKLFFILAAIILLIALLSILLLNRKTSDNKQPKELVKEYMEKYKKLDKSVVQEIEFPFQDNLSNIQKERYEGIIKFKYEQIEYSIVDGEETAINDNDAVIAVRINTVDINAAYEKATTYIENHKDEFESLSDEIEYKLDTISKYKLKEDYQILFHLYKKGEEWKLAELSKADVNKIKGLY